MHILDSEFLQDFKFVIGFLLRFVELPNIRSKKLTCFFPYIAMKTTKIDILEVGVNIQKTVL